MNGIQENNHRLDKCDIPKFLDLLNYRQYQKKPLKVQIIVDDLNFIKGCNPLDHIQASSLIMNRYKEDTS